MSTFKFAGVSTLNGTIKARFANDQMRVKVLAKNGHKDIDIIELKHPMTKTEIVEYLLSINFDNGNKAVRAALEAEVEKRTETPKATKAAPKAKAPAKKSKPSLDAIAARAKATKPAVPKSTVTKAEVQKQLADLEDAPYYPLQCEGPGSANKTRVSTAG
jgi:hypothetical protein